MNETESNAIVVATLMNKNHERIGQAMIDRVAGYLSQPELPMITYGIDTTYSFQETESATIKIDDKTKLSIQIVVSK